MFYDLSKTGEKTEIKMPVEGTLAAGYIDNTDLLAIYKQFGFTDANANACQMANNSFRSAVELYPNYTFTELRIFDPETPDAEDCLALFIKKDMFLVVDVQDEDHSTIDIFKRTINRISAGSATLEKIVYVFFDELMARDVSKLEAIGDVISGMEEDMLANRLANDFNRQMLDLKKKLQRMHNLYEQYLDIFETLDIDENDIFPSDSLLYIANLDKRVTRLREDVDSLSNDLTHLQDACFAQLDLKTNQTMNFLTVMTTIFFPLTIIVGWYGMNFTTMPELTWKYGYIFVILLSVAVVAGLVIIAKKKKWF